MPRVNKTKFSILGALSFAPMSGYDVKHWVLRITGPFWSESDGQIYPALARLQKEGLIKCDKTKANGKRPRKVYKITQKGLRELRAWLTKPANKRVERNELLLKIFLGKNTSKQCCVAHLERRFKEMQEKIEHHCELEQHIRKEHCHESDSFYWLISLKNAIYHMRAELAWCEEVLKILKKSKYKNNKGVL